MYAQRMMDDIIDLEMEKIETIIAKIEADPETDEVKATELNLWKKIKDKTCLLYTSFSWQSAPITSQKVIKI